jgi:phosphate:Na+ symporter
VDWTAIRLGIADNDYTLKLAIFHSIFNLIGIVVMLPFVNYLVTGLEKLIPEKTPVVDQPKYLSTASAEFPDTAIEAVKNETRRVFDAAIDIIANGIGIKKTDDAAGFHLDDKFTGQPRDEEHNIDAMYAKHIKTIYSAIVAFISETAFSRRDERSAGLQWLREANTQIVEAIKDTKHLQKNLQRYVVSGNRDIRNTYNRLRGQIASTIQDIHKIRQEEDGVMDMLSLDALKLVIDEHRDSLTEETTKLIARRKISPQMGSSLLNDSVYAHDISLNLVLAAQTLFGAAERELLHAARSVSLDDSERAEIQAREQSSAAVDRPG